MSFLKLSMDIGLLYAVTAFICVIVVAIVLNRTCSTKYRDTIDRSFVRILLFFIAFSLVDGVWGLYYSDKSPPNEMIGFTVMTYGFHLMAAISAFVWAGYIIDFVRAKRTQKTILNVFRGCLIVSQITLLAENIRSGFCFEVLGWHSVTYLTHTGRTVLFWLQFAYYVIVFISVLFTSLMKSGTKEKKRCRAAVIFSLVPLIAGFFQWVFPDAPMYSVGFMLSAVMIYSFNVTVQREAYLASLYQSENEKLSAIASGLSGDFDTVYYIDLDTGKYEVIGKGVFADALGENGSKQGNDFFSEGIAEMKRVFEEEDYPVLDGFLSKEHILEELRAKQSFSFNCRIAEVGSSRYYMLKIIRGEIDGEKGSKCLIGIFDDDERVRTEMEKQEELRLARLRAEQASEAKTQFLFNMSHDIRTPMNAILGFAEIAKKNVSDPEKVSDSLDKVHTAGNHLLSLINDILDMSRIESGKVILENKPFSPMRCTEDILNIVGTMAEEKQITIDVTEKIPVSRTVLGDETHVGRVLINILTNAVKYTNPGGRVEFSISEKPTEEAGLSAFTVIVSDNGIGMSEEFLRHVFEIFSRERNTTVSGVQGTGLGMAITKSLMDLMGGSIDVESKPGVGTKITLVFRFRLADGVSGEAGEKEITEADLARLKGKRLLLVEDNELNREIADDLLADLGLIVDNAEDGTFAVEKCRALSDKPESERYDFILMDVQMPIMDGYTAAREIRNLPDPYFASVPIIAMTANVFAEDAQKSKQAGMNHHLGKPINVKELTSTLLGYSRA